MPIVAGSAPWSRTACSSSTARTVASRSGLCVGDPARVPQDRRGLRDSVVGRLQRVGGTAVVHSNPGEGTEVELTLPRSAS